MKFSSQEEYGLRCLIQIARSTDSTTIPEIARNEGLSEAYVGKLLMILRKGGFITSTRGQSGGYTLASEPQNIVIGSVLAALGGRLFEHDFCSKHSGAATACTHAGECSVMWIWSAVQDSVDQVLQRITLKDVLDGSQQLIQVLPKRPTVGSR